MAVISYDGFRAFLREMLTAWPSWGADFRIDGVSQSDAEALENRYMALEREIRFKADELATLKEERNGLAKRIETLGVRGRLAVLASFAPDSIQARSFPIFGHRRRGAPTQKALTRRKNEQFKRDAIETAAREALKAELRAELAQEKARLE